MRIVNHRRVLLTATGGCVLSVILLLSGVLHAQDRPGPGRHTAQDFELDSGRQATSVRHKNQMPQTDQVITPHESGPFHPWKPRPATPPPGVILRSGPVVRDGYMSIQVNVDLHGRNIPGDAANEPSIAVDPTDPKRIVIGWRQFDSVESGFRQAGWAYSDTGGFRWVFPGVLEPGVFRSDPVLDVDADGTFYYYSLSVTNIYSCEMFRSQDGGLSWTGPVSAWGGDKPWIAVDRTSGIGRGNIYATWSGGGFTRSTDGANSFLDHIGLPRGLRYGTMAVGPDGELYVSGVSGGIRVTRSLDAQDPSVIPSFEPAVGVDLGGTLSGGFDYGPNGFGLLGQLEIDVDRSTGTSRGNVYLLGSVFPYGNDLDVMLARSVDGGLTWSSPVRINDDPIGNGAWQWFGTMSVAPNGRIDVVWNDTRNTGVDNLSELFYSYSVDEGLTWTQNVPVSPIFDSYVGWPMQQKIGDYYGMVSDDLGVNVAYAATFNGEQDIYFLRIGPSDCNGNGVIDADDIANLTSDDCNGNAIPDECDNDCNDNGIADDCEPHDDADGDDIWDICDNCVNDVNPGQEDCDDDGIGDACESDVDLDSVPDDCDNCPNDANPGQEDCDGDGPGDVCESDVDSDGVPDDCDNCPNHANTNQNDCDHDGVGDACVLAECPAGDLTCGDCEPNGEPDWCALLVPEMTTVLAASDGADDDRFAWDIAVDGSFALVGAEWDDENGFRSGSAYIFRLENGQWIEETKLVAPDGGADDHFGGDVAIQGDTALIGAHGHVGGGAVYVFRNDGSSWQFEQKLNASDEGGSFGSDVSLVGNMAVVGARLNSENVEYAGAAYVFRRDGSTWTEEAKLTPADGDYRDFFGAHVATTGSVIVAAVPQDTHVEGFEGSVYVFRFSEGIWVEEAKLVPSDAMVGDEFAVGAEILDDAAGRIAVSSNRKMDNGGFVGAVYLYSFDGASWIEEQKLLAPLSVVRDKFRRHISFSSDVLAVEASGYDDEPEFVDSAVHVFRLNGDKWGHQARLTPPEDQDWGAFFGTLVLSGNALFVGGVYARIAGVRTGAAFVHDLWAQDCNETGIPDGCELLDNDCDDNGVPDECDPAIDGDGDGVADQCDNCPGIHNPGQNDIDLDGLGDACDSVVDIPTTSQWGMVALVMLLLAAGTVMIKRRLVPA